MAAEFRERETKFDVASDWVLPDLDGLLPEGGHIQAVRLQLTSQYLDTASHDLLCAGATLRRRSGGTDVGWHLKVLDGDARTEVRAPVVGAGVPSELRELIVGVRSGDPLRALVTMATTRTAYSIVTADGTVLAEIADDVVSAIVYGPRRRTVAWREVEVELVAGDEGFLKRSGRLLVKAGAAPGNSASKVARALARPTHDTAPDTSLNALIRAYLTAQVDALLQRDIDLRRGQDIAHPARVAIRRFRSVLHAFSDVFDPQRAQALNDELSWFAALLGDVRDRDVLRAHLAESIAELPPEAVVGPVADHIDAILTSERDRANSFLAKAIRTPRYFSLIRELKLWRDDPAFLDGQEPRGGVAGRVRTAVAKMEQRARDAMQPNPDQTAADEAVHRARKSAKRARYVAELARPRLGNKAKTIIAATTAMQDRLGSHQDSVIAMEFLLRAQAIADRTPGHSPFTYGALWSYEHAKAAAARTSA